MEKYRAFFTNSKSPGVQNDAYVCRWCSLPEHAWDANPSFATQPIRGSVYGLLLDCKHAVLRR